MKQLLFLVILLGSAFYIGKNLNTIKARLKKLNIQSSKKTRVIAAVICVLAGIFIANAGTIFNNTAGLILFAPKVKITKNANEFVLCDFESENDIKIWNTQDSDVTLSDEYVTSGKHSGRFKYTKGVTLSKIAIEKYFYRDRRLGDWRGYKYLLFDVYSLQPNSERIILKIRDSHDKVFNRDIIVPSKKKYTVKIYLSELKASVDISKICQLNLFRWEPKTELTVYVDNVRLVNDAESNEGRTTIASLGGETTAEGTRDEGRELNATPNTLDANTPNLTKASEKRELVYLLQPDLEKYTFQKNDTDNTKIIRFDAFVSNPLKAGRRAAPSTGGIPFAKGELSSLENLNIIDSNGSSLTFQTKATAYWPDKSIKWLLVDLQTDLDPVNEKQIFLEYGPTIKQTPATSPLKVFKEKNSLLLFTGPLKAVFNTEKFDLCGNVYWDKNNDGQFSADEIVLNSGDMYIDCNNKRYFASLDKKPEVKVEVEGSERVSIKRSGWFVAQDGAKFCKYILRIEAFRGKTYLRTYHTFIYTGYPENKLYDRYEELKLPKNETIQEIGVLLPQSLTGNRTYSFGADGKIASSVLANNINMVQDQADSFNVFADSGKITQGKQLSGWFDVKNNSVGITTAIRFLWQQFPKAFTLDKDTNTLDIKLWPKEAGELDLKTSENALGPDALARGNAFGIAKTHELYFYIHEPNIDSKTIDAVAATLTNPIHIRPSSQWVAATKVLGGLRQFDQKRFFDAETSLAELFSWAYRQPKAFRWYGMIDFGDTLTWYRKEAYDKSYDTWGWHPEGRWGWFNCEAAGTHSGALLQYLRTGQQRYFEFGENLSRHIMDVDTCHYNTIANDPRLKSLLDDEVSQVGSMHRHNGNHWGGRNEEATHTNNFGILLYYYLTGYERAHDVALETGEFFLKSPITYTRHPDIAPQRGIANVLWGDMMLYEATGEKKYLNAAGKWARLFVKGQHEDGFWQDTYDPLDDVWNGQAEHSFMAEYTLPALIQYHIATGDGAVASAIIRATDYLMGHEEYRGYFDALAYSFYLTGDKKYQAFAENYLATFSQGVHKDGDDLHRGMIFDKLSYSRPGEYLYDVPFVFELLAYKPNGRNTLNAKLTLSSPSNSRDIDQNIDYSIGVVSSLVKVFPDSKNLLNTRSSVNISLAKNEYESIQALIYNANKDLKNVTVHASDLVDKQSGAIIPKENVEVRLVEYIKTKKPDYEVDRVGYWPDPLTKKEKFNVTTNTIQPVWITIYASKETVAGHYEGSITISPDNAAEKIINISTRVREFELPQTPSFKTAFDLYYGRMKKGYAKNFQEDDAQYQERLARLVDTYYKTMLKFKVSPILNIDFPNPRFDAQIKSYLELGMSAFGVGPYGGSEDNNWPKDRGGLESLIEHYRGIAVHLKERNWLDKAYIYTYDEPQFGDEHVAEVASMLHKAEPRLKNMVCLGDMQDPLDYSKWVKDIDIFVIRNFGFDYDMAKKYRALGKELWIYVSGPKPPFPNLAIDFPSTAYRILPWMGWKYDVTGLLYWCVNYWNEDVWTNPMNTKWEQNGNGFLFYPGKDEPIPTIRLYALRDGIEDYEYLKILSQAYSQEKDNITPELDARVKKLLVVDDAMVESMASYTKNPSTILARRDAIAETIEALKATVPPTKKPIETTSTRTEVITEDFSKALEAQNGKTFGSSGQLTFELYRNGSFIIEGNGVALQDSQSYGDVALIRSRNPLPKTYTISAIVGDIDYDLSKIERLKPDPEYSEGPLNENGVYLLAIIDTLPNTHHTNDWWHQHRKVCIDVDNNIWGSGMPNPIFMTYYDNSNKMMAFDGDAEQWHTKWNKAVTYEKNAWYKIEIEKTKSKYILKIFNDKGKLLKGSMIDLKEVLYANNHPDYFVIGDPHENYYQGSMKIKSITIAYPKENGQ